jgi:hypothetical protein
MQYENFTQLPSEDIDAMFQRFTAIVNNMKANVQDFPYTKHDQALKLLHILDPNVWGAKVEAIKESGQYLTIELDDLFSKLKSAEVDSKLQSKHEGSTDHSLAFVGGSKGKVLTQNLHPTSSTQQAEQASFRRKQIPRRASQFSLKINKRQSS